MTEQNPVQIALTLPQGARFHKCALQVNPHHYAGTYRGQPSPDDETSYVRKLIAKANEQEISVLAITDHNHVGSVPVFRREASQSGIHIFPGFEITSSENIHVLCIYPQDTDDGSLNRFLGEFGLRGTSPSAELSSKSFGEIIRCVKDQGGIAIAAHVSQGNGLLTTLQGQARIKAWQDRNLLAVQVPGAVDDLPQDLRQIVRNKNDQYRRDTGVADDLGVAVINATDVKDPEGLAEPTASCWIKMSEVSIEGFRQAFLDPKSRIRLASDPVPDEHAELVAMTWQGGFLDGAAIHFNENLNVLIGGRGTGKSTVVESIRYVLGLEPLGDDARKIHEGILRNVLGGATKISLLVKSHRGAKRQYTIERTIPNPPIVKDELSNVVNLAPADLLQRIEVYGQHEISELTKSRQKLTRLLERFIDREDSLARRKVDAKRELERSRVRITEVQKELAQVGEQLASLPGLEETLKSYQAAGLEGRLKEQSLVVREEQILNTVPERLAPFRDCLEMLRRELPIDTTFVSAKALEDLPGKNILLRINETLGQLGRDLEDAANRMQGAMERAERELGQIKEQWSHRKQEVQATYEKILRELHKSRVDGEEFIRLRRRIEELRPLRDRDTLFKRTFKELEEYRRKLLDEWEDVKAQEFRNLERAAKKVSRKLSSRVRVQVSFAGNREPLFEVLRQDVGGRLSETIDALRSNGALSISAFAQAIRVGAAPLVLDYGIPATQADRLAKASAEAVMRIEELDLPPTTKLELNVGSDDAPSWQVLEDLSTGQKATAVLLLLLLESDAPLIVDQPEDDLDNRFITDGIVPKMREEKRRRQFIFATHNANIPVLGDAELILGLSASGEAGQGNARIPVEFMGSIDIRPVRELVEEILEGGREAFEMRRLKYGF
ncbi:MAG: AAA family ATPase [Betaproteobacteria bacterium]|nr:AAA family ATPase [Betaproteobacteria bacterium]